MSKNESASSDEFMGWGVHEPAPPRPEERFIYTYDTMRVVEIVSEDEAGNLVFSDGGTVSPEQAAQLRFSASPLDALYRVRAPLGESEYQSMMDLSAYDVGDVRGVKRLKHLKWVQDNLEAINRAINAETGR